MKKYFAFLLLLLFSFQAYSQEVSADSLFSQARTAAFKDKDYTKSIALSKQALQIAPDYTDISIFLGRVYAWNKETDAARAVFEELDRKNIQNEDFFFAYSSLEYWNEQNAKAIDIAEKGLAKHPNSESLLILKAKALYAEKNYTDAEIAINNAIKINPTNTEANTWRVRINDYIAKNAVNILYTYSHFDKQFADDWHIVGVSYRRQTPIGPVILRGNYASKFGDNGTQIELEAYPRLSKTFYLYVGGAYSNNVGIFPKYRSGLSLNANLPKSFEAEIGFRQLYFYDNLWMYTASVGKYYKNFWFNLRTYITPSNENISQSYTGTVRYYTKSAQDYFQFQIGTGITPEESRNNLLQNETYKLKTFKIGGEYDFSVKRNLFSIGAIYYNTEYQPNVSGNQFDVILGYTYKF